MDKIVEVFECPVCLGYVLPPIRQCCWGHICCASCIDKLTACPMCRDNKGFFRNMALERVAEFVPFPCRYKNAGCQAKATLSSKSQHEETCVFKPCFCLLHSFNCCWTGTATSCINHMVDSHPNFLKLQSKEGQFNTFDISCNMVPQKWGIILDSYLGCAIFTLETRPKQDEGFDFYASGFQVGAEHDPKLKIRLNFFSYSTGDAKTLAIPCISMVKRKPEIPDESHHIFNSAVAADFMVGTGLSFHIYFPEFVYHLGLNDLKT